MSLTCARPRADAVVPKLQSEIMKTTGNRASPPLVSCLMVTQPGREALLADSLACLGRQSYPDIELVVVHDGGDAFHATVGELAGNAPVQGLRLVRADAGLTLGALRNIAIDNARGDLLCQWDDDDLYHPRYIERMGERLAETGSEFCLMTSQLHLYRGRRLLFWEDYTAMPVPRRFIEGTLFGRRRSMPRYPERGLGEDTAVLERILGRGARVAGLEDAGWLRMYTWHGGNAWDFRHHADITRAQRRGAGFLLARAELLKRVLGEYRFPGPAVRFPHEAGALLFERARDGSWSLAPTALLPGDSEK